MKQVTKMQQRYYSLGDKVRYYYWAWEGLLHELGLWTMPPFILIGIFFFFAQVDYALHGKDLDLSLLPTDKKERLATLFEQEKELDTKERKLRKNLDFKDARAVSKQRTPLVLEINSIIATAPHSAWSHKLYSTLGLIKDN